ncbi:cell wall metabolism sensor histidine kinase WalK [Paenibacillus sp. NEAU-GSW1]|uniref:sensor histidine kinase n=1 Tax=Paenibacillus sp. NEAU-GSW1 TaxID=2682486 RepID=UPI0012E10074|nr:HAMP domain-containing sensor histidine kinase [Paenibacillus sp. NEAU-GSW1]MUT68818.1 GHKL domain-containing protein [Paenibacillus sp. NEAU-GSW1]
MIKRTLVQMTIWNSAIVFCLLILLGGALYGLARYQIYSDIDRRLVFDIDHLQQVTLSTGEKVINIASTEPERFSIAYYWNSSDVLIGRSYYKEPFISLSSMLQYKQDHFGPESVQFGKKTYRFVSRPYQGNLSEIEKLSDLPLKTVQIITEISAEVYYLNRLLWGIGIGIGIGAILSVIAGYALARRALVPIQKAWDKQQQFIADASHELRSPLSVVHGQMQLLLRHPDHTIEDESVAIAAILKETKRMSNMVGGLLLLARGDSHEEEIVCKPVRIDGIIKEIANNMEPIMDYKQLRLQLHVEGAELLIHGDEDRLMQLFMILIDNAIKFTQEQGQIDLECFRQGKSVVVTVKDNGAGISERDLPLVFNRFYKGDSARDRGEHGAGLGLSIASWIVDQHRGSVHISSEVGCGTTVTIRFPGIG